MSSQLLTRVLGSAKATLRAPLITSIPTSQRLFHSTRFSLNEDKPEGEEGAASEESEETPVNKKLPFRRRNFHKWLQGEGSRFATPSFSGPNYIGESVTTLFFSFFAGICPPIHLDFPARLPHPSKLPVHFIADLGSFSNIASFPFFFVRFCSPSL